VTQQAPGTAVRVAVLRGGTRGEMVLRLVQLLIR
jgi:hypothetical protein